MTGAVRATDPAQKETPREGGASVVGTCPTTREGGPDWRSNPRSGGSTMTAARQLCGRLHTLDEKFGSGPTEGKRKPRTWEAGLSLTGDAPTTAEGPDPGTCSRAGGGSVTGERSLCGHVRGKPDLRLSPLIQRRWRKCATRRQRRRPLRQKRPATVKGSQKSRPATACGQPKEGAASALDQR